MKSAKQVAGSGATVRQARSSAAGLSGTSAKRAAPGKDKQKCKNECCEKLEFENLALKKELKETRTLYNQLVQESSAEKFSERRVNLLKAQVYQLERQVLLLTQSLNSRSSLVEDVHLLTDHLTTKLRGLAEDKESHCFRMSRREKDEVLDNVRRLHQTAAQTLKLCSKEELECSFAYYGQYACESPSVLHVMTDWLALKHLNLHQLSKLEGRLSLLYQSLTQLVSSLKMLPAPGSSALSPGFHHAALHAAKCSETLPSLCQDLLTLSLLVPGQQHNTKPHLLTIETMLQKLPPFARSKQEGSEIVQSVVQTLTDQRSKTQLTVDGLNEELRYYQQQLSYTRTVVESFQSGYGQFITSVNKKIIAPIEEVVSVHHKVMRNYHKQDESVQQLLDTIETHSPDFQEAAGALKKLFHEREWETLLKQCCGHHTKLKTPGQASAKPSHITQYSPLIPGLKQYCPKQPD